MRRSRPLRWTSPLHLLTGVLALTALQGCEPTPPPDTTAGGTPGAPDHAALTHHVLERLALQPDERVLLVALPGDFDAMVAPFREGVRAAGAEDLGAWAVEGPQPEAWATDFTARLAAARDEDLVDILGEVDAAVMMPGAQPVDPVYASLQEVLRRGHGRTVHFHWAGAYAPDGTLMDRSPAVDALYQDVLAGTDYAALAASQRAFEEAMRAAEVRVTTPAGTDLTFRIGDRPVTRQDGDASAARAARARNLIDREVELPAGAIRVAPIEESVNGTIAFPPSTWSGAPVRGLVLTIASGRVVDATAEQGLEAAVAEMDAAGPAGRAFRELALGFNPLLAVPDRGERWIPYYGYGAGVVRLSLGDNTELGGAVGGGYVRWNFFTDATVTVGGETWVEGGRLVR